MMVMILNIISEEKEISVEEIIQIHSSITYRVYMLGFFRVCLYGRSR